MTRLQRQSFLQVIFLLWVVATAMLGGIATASTIFGHTSPILSFSPPPSLAPLTVAVRWPVLCCAHVPRLHLPCPSQSLPPLLPLPPSPPSPSLPSPLLPSPSPLPLLTLPPLPLPLPLPFPCPCPCPSPLPCPLHCRCPCTLYIAPLSALARVCHCC